MLVTIGSQYRTSRVVADGGRWREVFRFHRTDVGSFLEDFCEPASGLGEAQSEPAAGVELESVASKSILIRMQRSGGE